MGGKMATNREIEVKLPVPDVAKLIARLRKLGAKKIGRVYEHNTLFDTEDGCLRQQEAILRIRREQDIGSSAKSGRRAQRSEKPAEGLLTFKGLSKGRVARAGKYKEREEIECRISDARQFARILWGMGMRAWFQYEKYRTKYLAADPSLHFDLDETPIGTFLELEGPKRSIDRAAQALEYATRDYITASYWELYNAECARRGRKVANMVFTAKKKRSLRHSALDNFCIYF
jgi:adenylate cyclase, class 2